MSHVYLRKSIEADIRQRTAGMLVEANMGDRIAEILAQLRMLEAMTYQTLISNASLIDLPLIHQSPLPMEFVPVNNSLFFSNDQTRAA